MEVVGEVLLLAGRDDGRRRQVTEFGHDVGVAGLHVDDLHPSVSVVPGHLYNALRQRVEGDANAGQGREMGVQYVFVLSERVSEPSWGEDGEVPV